tara:strand:- start:142 stop:324 length:183 start_codon:yes stop_codon:yes gene_type:complete
MNDFLEFDNDKKTILSLNLDDFSIEDLKKYVEELNKEISRVNSEMDKKTKVQKEAQKYFK